MLTESQLIWVNIDGQDVHVPQGINIIQAASKLGIEIPHFCYHSKLSVSGNCRMCLVETGMPIKDKETNQILKDDQGHPRITWALKPVIACGTQVVEGIHIRTRTEKIKDCQRGVMEFLLLNHPLDCPICDQAGECQLQEYAADYGRGYSRSHELKNKKPKQTQIGERIILDDERCILCSRCIRFCREILKEDYLGFIDRGSYTTLTCLPNKPFNHNYSLNTVDICPVGALTSSDFRFQMRVWFLKKTPSICTESSTGVNTFVWSREGKIYRITPRQNDLVNSCWMPDSGRMLYKKQEEGDRLDAYYLHGAHVDYEETIVRIGSLLAEGRVGCVCSGHMSLEEQFLLSQIIEKIDAKTYLIEHQAEDDGFLIDADRTPNKQGALLCGLSKEPLESLLPLQEDIENGLIKTLIVCNEDLVKSGMHLDILKKVKIIYIGTHQHTASNLTAEIPSRTVFEKDGTFVNRNFRLQKFFQAIPFKTEVLPDYCFFDSVRNYLLSKQTSCRDLESIWSEMSEKISTLKNIQFGKIPLDGIQLEY